MLRPVLKFVRTTVVGGIIFLIPLLVVSLIIGQALAVGQKLATPLSKALPRWLEFGVAVHVAIPALGLLLLAFLAGLFARTSAGAALFTWVENSIVGALPQFNFARGVAESLEAGEEKGKVVLVPTDAGLQFGFLFEEPVDGWYAVFIPGAPQWTSGSVVFAEEKAIRPLDMTMLEATRFLKRLGAHERELLKRLPPHAEP